MASLTSRFKAVSQSTTNVIGHEGLKFVQVYLKVVFHRGIS